MFILNETGRIQVFDNWGVDFTIQKNYAVPLTFVKGGVFTTSIEGKPGFSKWKSFENIRLMFGENVPIVLNRSFALGDVLMLVPVINYLKSIGWNAWLDTDFTRFTQFTGLDIRYRRMKETPIGLMLDHLLEFDHNPDHPYSRLHRVDIYADALGIKIPKKLNWNIDFKETIPIDDTDYVAVQVGGSTRMKTLKPGYIMTIVRLLRKRGYKVVLFGVSNGDKIQMPDIDGVLNLIDKIDLRELFGLIRRARILISMDSSPLWISHFTRTPVIMLHGSTRVQERLTRHPLFPHQTGSVDLAGLVGCTACFETAKYCADKISCMRTLSVKRLGESVGQQLNKLEGNI